MPGGEVDVLPRDAFALRRRRVPRVMWVREAHPHEPVVFVRERVEERDRAVGDPVGVVQVARDRVDLRLGRARLASTLGLEQRGEAVYLVRVLLEEPRAVVLEAAAGDRRRVHGELGVLEAPQRSVEPSGAIAFSGKVNIGSKPGSKCALPSNAVRYPACSARCAATLGASCGSCTPFANTPCVRTY